MILKIIWKGVEGSVQFWLSFIGQLFSKSHFQLNDIAYVFSLYGHELVELFNETLVLLIVFDK